jgi:hypothetical protein
MQYYLRKSDLVNPKNKAQAHLQEFTEKFNHMLINSGDDLKHIIKTIEAEVTDTNIRYPRCSDIKTNIQEYEHSDSVDIWLHTGGESSFISLYAMKVQKEYHRGAIEECII